MLGSRAVEQHRIDLEPHQLGQQFFEQRFPRRLEDPQPVLLPVTANKLLSVIPTKRLSVTANLYLSSVIPTKRLFVTANQYLSAIPNLRSR